MKNEKNGIRPLPTVPFTKEKSCRIVIIYIYIYRSHGCFETWFLSTSD